MREQFPGGIIWEGWYKKPHTPEHRALKYKGWRLFEHGEDLMDPNPLRPLTRRAVLK